VETSAAVCLGGIRGRRGNTARTRPPPPPRPSCNLPAPPRPSCNLPSPPMSPWPPPLPSPFLILKLTPVFSPDAAAASLVWIWSAAASEQPPPSHPLPLTPFPLSPFPLTLPSPPPRLIQLLRHSYEGGPPRHLLDARRPDVRASRAQSPQQVEQHGLDGSLVGNLDCLALGGTVLGNATCVLGLKHGKRVCLRGKGRG
jgi:hypothetical protein